MKTVCPVCPHHCHLEEGQRGFCNARINDHGKVICDNYGKITSMALDPIEKKPLNRFMPGSRILSIGSFGCNLRCPFCQNHTISMSCGENQSIMPVTPMQLTQQALSLRESGNIGVAYTYNEPLIGFEYILDSAKLVHGEGMKNVIVSNGYIEEEPLLTLLPFIDAMNIDLKGFTETFYQKLRGDLETVKRTIRIAAQHTHVEVTTLIVPDENDSEAEIEELAAWLASVDEKIPLHLSRFFPLYAYANKTATSVNQIYRLADVARKHLRYVYTGNC